MKSRGTPIQLVSRRQPFFLLRSGARKLWSDENLLKAVTAVEKKGERLRETAEKYGIPRSTLFDHTSGRVEFGLKPGPRP